MDTKYMIIDITTVEGTRILGVESMAKAVAWGKIYRHGQHDVIVPPVEGRGFAKLELLQLQYLFWNTFNEAPSDDYSAMVQRLKAYAETFPEGSISLEDLEDQVAKLYPEEPKSTAPQTQREPRTPREPGERPKEGSTTGKVWAVADACFNNRPTIGKELRTDIMTACKAEGINEATAATQYSKWKAAKLAATGA